jgi:hypothetical protein
MRNQQRGIGPTLENDDEVITDPELTAQPRERFEHEEEDGDRVVPASNVGGAVPTVLGGDSGGDWPGAEDDLSNLAEPEPPQDPPEIGAMHVRPSERRGR